MTSFPLWRNDFFLSELGFLCRGLLELNASLYAGSLINQITWKLYHTDRRVELNGRTPPAQPYHLEKGQ